MFMEGKQFYYNYDLDSLSYKYGRIGDSTGLGIPGRYGVTTVGSSTTVTAVTAGALIAFSMVKVGDIIVFEQPPDTKIIRKVATKVSAGEITVDTAVNLSAGAFFFFYPFTIGTAAGNGWHHVQAYSSATIWVRIDTLAAAGGLDISIEGRSPNIGGSSTTLLTKNYAATGTEAINIGEVVGAVRVGVKGGSGFAGTDVFSIWMTGEIRTRS